MTYTAMLTSITRVKEVGETLFPFVRFKAELDKRELDDEAMVAILQIAGTTSYYVVFLDDKVTMADVEKDLAEQDSALHAAAKKALAKHIKE